MVAGVVRSAIIAAVVVLSTADARAGACPPSLGVRAYEAKLAGNGVVLFEASDDGEDMRNALVHARFVGGGGAVPAKILRAVDGGRLQVLLTPATELKAGAKVRLSLGLPEADANLANRVFEVGAVDDATPAWTGEPKVGKHRIEPSNKDDSVDAWEVTVPLDRAAFVLATLQGADTVRQAIYRPEGGIVVIGATGCHSAFRPHLEKGPFRVTLTAIGAGGRERVAPGKPFVLAF